MKIKLILTLVLLTLCMPNTTTAQDMTLEKCAFWPGLDNIVSPNYFKPTRITFNYIPSINDCPNQYPNMTPGSNDIITFSVSIACMGPDDCVPDYTNVTFDSCNYWWNGIVITSELKDINGNIVAKGEKHGMSFVDASTIDETQACRSAAWSGPLIWINAHTPPKNSFNTFNPGMTYGYMHHDDKNNSGNYIVLPQGFKNGIYEFCSHADFSNYINQNQNIFPDGFCCWVEITDSTVIAIPAPSTIFPSTPSNIVIRYNPKLSKPLTLTWDDDSNVDGYKIERWIKRGNKNFKANSAESIHSFFVDDIRNLKVSALVKTGGDKGIKIYYKIKAINSSGESEWYKTTDIKL